jgi:hypothetical protein
MVSASLPDKTTSRGRSAQFASRAALSQARHALTSAERRTALDEFEIMREYEELMK